MPGLGLSLGLKSRFRRVAAILSLRQQIEGLRYRVTPSGRTSVAALKVPGIDALPAGMTRSGTTITNTGYAGDLLDWDFRNHMLVVRCPMGAIRQCLFGQTGSVKPLSYLNPQPGGDVRAVEHCDFAGPASIHGSGSAIVQSMTVTDGAIAAYGRLRSLRNCRFEGLSSDALKLLGDDDAEGQVVEWNYFGPPRNLPYVPPAYNAGTTYALDDLVTSGAYRFRSLVNGNVGNSLPAFNTSNAFWATYDPHSDAITTVAALGGGITIRRNLFDYTDDPVGADGPFLQVGVNNAIRISRNTNTSYPVNRLDVVENVLYHGPYGSYPIEAKDGGQPNFDGPITFEGNWIGANAGGGYFHPSTNGSVHAWSGNRDVATDAAIPAPTLRVAQAVERMRIGFLGRSNLDYTLLTIRNSLYNSTVITRPSITNPNLVRYYGQNHSGAIFTMPVNDTTGSMDTGVNTNPNGVINIAMLTVAEWWEKLWPDIELDLVDLAYAGMQQSDLLDDQNTSWLWSDFNAVIDQDPSRGELDLVIHRWGDPFPNKPDYLRLNQDGTPATLGGARDQTFWNLTVPAGERGTPPAAFSTNTKLAVVPVEQPSYHTAMEAMFLDPDWQRIVRPKRIGASVDVFAADGGHAYPGVVAGQVLAAMVMYFPHIAEYMHSRGLHPSTVGSPSRQALQVASDGSYADILIELINGGSLQTPREAWGIAFPASPRSDQQPVNWVKILRVGEMEGGSTPPVYRLGTATPAAHQGTVVFQDRGSVIPSVTLADGTVVTNGRWGRIRVTPNASHPFVNGDALLPGRTWWDWVDQGATPSTQEPTLDIPKESVPHMTPAGCLRPYPGVDLMRFHPAHVVSGLASAAYPITDPTIVQDFNGSGTRIVGPAFTMDPGKQYVLAVAACSGDLTNTADLLTVRIGAQGRAAGTGTVVARGTTGSGQAWRKQNRAEASVYPVPYVAGSSTLALEYTTGSRRSRAVLLEIDGTSGTVGAVGGFGNVSANASLHLATTGTQSLVLYVVVKIDGSDAGAVTVDPAFATTLVSGPTSPAKSTISDNQVFVGYERAPVAGTYSVAWTSGLSNNVVALAVELVAA